MARAVRTRRGTASLALREDGSLRIGVVADTHSVPNEAGLVHLAARKPDAILHGGDIGDLRVLERLKEIAPVIAVRGNIDERHAELPDVITLDVTAAGESALRILLTHIAVAGPKIRADVARTATAAGARLVVCGHSHVPFIGRDRGLTVFNPGSIGPRRFALPIVFGMLEILGGKLDVFHVDAATGQRWLPGAAAHPG